MDKYSGDSGVERQDIFTFISTVIGKIVEGVVKGLDGIADDDSGNAGKCSFFDDKGNQETKKRGYAHVENMMKSWKKMPDLLNWCYDIKYMNEMSRGSSKNYAYEVKWTQPMDGYTYPVITLSVFIFLKFDPENSESPAHVKYVFEGNRYAHDSRLAFNPEWLHNAYESKKGLIETFISEKR